MTLTFKQSIEAFPIFQLIDVSVPNENDSCSVFQMVVHRHNTIIESTSFNDGSFQLVVESISILISEGAQFTPATLQTFELIVRFEEEPAQVQADCRVQLFRNILSLLQRLQNIS
jgi:hypothetical protein